MAVYKMAKYAKQPTDTELSILRILWDSGPATVRAVHESFARERDTDIVYTTVLKLMQLMYQKGLVTRDESSRSHVYSARVTEGDIQDRFVENVLERAFGGSAGKLVMNALSRKRASVEDIRQIRELLDRLERDR